MINPSRRLPVTLGDVNKSSIPPHEISRVLPQRRGTILSIARAHWSDPRFLGPTKRACASPVENIGHYIREGLKSELGKV